MLALDSLRRTDMIHHYQPNVASYGVFFDLTQSLAPSVLAFCTAQQRVHFDHSCQQTLGLGLLQVSTRMDSFKFKRNTRGHQPNDKVQVTLGKTLSRTAETTGAAEGRVKATAGGLRARQTPPILTQTVQYNAMQQVKLGLSDLQRTGSSNQFAPAQHEDLHGFPQVVNKR